MTTDSDLECPACTATLKNTTRVTTRGPEHGQPGDLVMCAACGEMSELARHGDGTLTLVEANIVTLAQFQHAYGPTIQKLQALRVRQLLEEDPEDAE